MSRRLYSVLLLAAMPFVLARLWWRGRREPGYRRHVRERFGFGTGAAGNAPAMGIDAGPVWIHAVSVGEARAAAPLVHALRERRPERRLLVTCMTAAGRETIESLYGAFAEVRFLPYDLPGAVSRFLDRTRPALGVLMETEIWPNLLAACAARRIPVVLANARLAERSAAGYLRRASLSQPAFASIACVCAQTEADARRLRAAGARSVVVSGNLKFDAAVDASRFEAGRSGRRAWGARAVVLLVSTREGEEEALVDAFAAAGIDALVVAVPRHPARFDAVGALLEARAPGRVARRSNAGAAAPDSRYLIGDTMGEMAYYLGLADVAVIGGGFGAFGGQNLIEACAAGVPVIVGPHMENFAEATMLGVDATAVLQVDGPAEAAAATAALLADAERRRRMSEAGIALVAGHRGATARHLAVCEELLAEGKASAARAV